MLLDEEQTYERFDKSNMRGLIASLPEQCRTGAEMARHFKLPPGHKGLSKAILFGMGGSAIGGDLVADLQALEGYTTLQIHRDYGHKGLADENTLAIASSNSGNTEETVSAFQSALESGAKCAAITRGGRIAELCKEKGVPVFTFEQQGPPRTALGFSVFPILGLLEAAKLAPDRSDQVKESITEMERLILQLGPDIPFASNPAKALALEVGERTAVVYGGQHLTGVARRWKTQIAENAKGWAFWEVIPEIHHNSVVALSMDGSLANTPFLVLMLRSPSYGPRIAARFEVTAELLGKAQVPFRWVDARGRSPLAQEMTATIFGDYVSLYLAMLRGVDPTPTPSLDWFKVRMAAR